MLSAPAAAELLSSEETAMLSACEVPDGADAANEDAEEPCPPKSKIIAVTMASAAAAAIRIIVFFCIGVGFSHFVCFTPQQIAENAIIIPSLGRKSNG